jgi:hypothetical protein
LSALRASLLAPLITLVSPAVAQVAQETQARIDALRRQVTELERREVEIQSRIAETGHADTAARGITLARATKEQAEHQIRQMRSIVDAYAQNVEDIEQLQRQAASDIDQRIEEANRGLANKAQDKALEYAGTQGLNYVLAAETGPLLSLGIKVIDHAGRMVVADINEDQLGEQVLAERSNLVKALEVIVMLSKQSSAETVRIRELESLQQQFRDNIDALAETRRRLDRLTGDAHGDANLARVTDAAGDEEEKRKQQGFGVRLCDPTQKHTPGGVRLSQNKKKGSTKEFPEDKAEKAAAEDDACLDITGFWTFTTSIQVHDRKVSTAPVRAEIAVAEGGDGSGYEFFAASKAQAPTGPIMKCSPAGQNLTCQRRVQPQACPEAKYVWQPLDLTVAADGSTITGEFQQTMTMDMSADPSGCTLTPFDGQGKMTYTFVPVEALPAVK